MSFLHSCHSLKCQLYIHIYKITHFYMFFNFFSLSCVYSINNFDESYIGSHRFDCSSSGMKISHALD